MYEREYIESERIDKRNLSFEFDKTTVLKNHTLSSELLLMFSLRRTAVQGQLIKHVIEFISKGQT